MKSDYWFFAIIALALAWIFWGDKLMAALKKDKPNPPNNPQKMRFTRNRVRPYKSRPQWSFLYNN